MSGISQEELREQVGAIPEVFNALSAMLVRDKKLEVAGELVRLPGHGVVMKDEEAESKKKIEDAFASAGLKVPALREVIAGLKVDKVRAQKIVTLLFRDKALIKVSDELVFHRSALEELRRQMAAYKVKSAKIDVAAVQRDDRGKPQVCDSTAGISGSRASDKRVWEMRARFFKN